MPASFARPPRDGAIVVKYVGNTGGLGVRNRSGCQEAAPGDGALADGAQLQIEQVGTGDCAGWSLVSAGAARSWIRDDYLTDSPPQAATTVIHQDISGPSTQAPSGPAMPPSLPPTMLTFTATGGALVSVAQLDGVGILQGGANGFTYLGIVSSSRTQPDSICNPTGAYGSSSSSTSIRNPRSEFGANSSDTSAYDPSASTPPRIRFKNETIGYLTKGSSLGRGSVDPDFILGALGCR